MCGLAFINANRPGWIKPSLLRAISGDLAHRGPDGEGFFLWDGSAPQGAIAKRDELTQVPVAMIHRRLSIIDTTTNASQPMQSRDGRFVLIFNGEIYNYVELRQHLHERGVLCSTQSDTEVLLNGLAFEGADFLKKIVGMFAFVLLDQYERSILVGRDFAGMKPLYFINSEDGIAFASELKPLLRLLNGRTRAASRELREFLSCARSDFQSQTMFQQVFRVPAGHVARIDLRRPAVPVFRPWRPLLISKERTEESLAEAAEALRKELLQAISLHLRSDVPLGAAVSGGIDSSSIVVAMRELLGPRHPILSFSYVAAEEAPSEEVYIDAASRAALTSSHKVFIEPGDFSRDIEDLVRVQEEPFISTSIYAQYRVFRAASEMGIKVTLDGQGSDEYFAGYPTFIASRLADVLRSGDLKRGVQLFRSTISRCILSRHGLLLRTARDLALRRHRPESGTFLVSSLLEAFTRTSLPPLLRYADRNSMRFSIESRMPFLTQSMIENVLALPGDYLIGNESEQKNVLKCAMRGLVPDDILDRKDKVGFVTPERTWVRALEPWANRLIDESEEMREFVNLKRLKQRVSMLQKGGQLDGGLWRALSALAWARSFDVRA